MNDIGAIVLYKIVETKSLHGWSRLKLSFLDSAYISLYTAIANYYNKYSEIPNFSELETYYQRDSNLSNLLFALKNTQVPEDIDLDLAIDVLTDTYTQNEALKQLDKLVDNITLMDSQEVKEAIAEVVLYLDEKTHTSESIVQMDNILLFSDDQISLKKMFPSGINNTFDSKLGGLAREELVLLGGKRGSGKSIVCANFIANQYEAGNTSVYFTIEMTAKETFDRIMAIMANIPHTKLRQNNLDYQEIQALAKIRANMFDNGIEAYNKFLEDKNKLSFETNLIRNFKLKQDNQIVIIDDRELSIISVDLHLQKLKSKFGDKLTVVVIDYLNQLVVPGKENSMYEWINQIFISKKLKELSRKYDVNIISPYQIDDTGNARFAKGILDAPDIALVLDTNNREDSIISFDTTKIRGGSPMSFSSRINWDSLRIDPIDVPKPEQSKKESKKQSVKLTNVEQSNDVAEVW